MASVRARIGEYVRTEQGFRRSGFLAFGTLFAIFMLWSTGHLGGVGWWLLLVALAYGAGWVWAYFMWQAMRGDVERINSQIEAARKAQAANNGTQAPNPPVNADACGNAAMHPGCRARAGNLER